MTRSSNAGQRLSVNPSTAAPARNRLLSELPEGARNRFIAQCEPVELEFGAHVGAAKAVCQYVYFPLTGFVSLLVGIHARPALEIGLVGNEGMVGATLALDVRDIALTAIVQGAGTALRIGAAQFVHALHSAPRLQGILKRYLYVQFTQVAVSAACIHFHDVDARLARWLLMSLDRSASEHLQLTHQYLANVLGVRRSAVTIAAGKLQQRGLIRYSRGDITVLSRRGLESASCSCYAEVCAQYEAYFPSRTVRMRDQ